MASKKYSFFNHDNANFRRDDTNGQIAVDDVWDHRDQRWHPYKGDGFKVGMWGDKIKDPTGGAGDGGESEDASADADGETEMAKSPGARVDTGAREPPAPK